MDKLIIGILIVLLIILVIGGYEWHSWNSAKQAAIDAGVIVDDSAPSKPITKVVAPEVSDADMMKQVMKQAEAPPMAPLPVPWPVATGGPLSVPLPQPTMIPGGLLKVPLPPPTMAPPSWNYEDGVSYVWGRVNYKQNTNGILYLGNFRDEKSVEVEALRQGCVAFSWHGKYPSDNIWAGTAYGFPPGISTSPTHADDKIVSARLM